MKNYILTICLIGVISACKTTQITSSWKEPNKQVTINQLNKVLVVAMLRNETNRHIAEDLMVQYLKGKGIVSYDYLDDNVNKKNEEFIREKIKTDGFDGAITMRLIDVDREKVFVPNRISSMSNESFGGYYFRNLPNYANSGYFETTKVFTVETVVFSIKENKIIWTGLTKTVNPGGVETLTKEIAKVIYKKMLKEGFIKETK